MKILFETDPHFKELGSLSNEARRNSKYSTRLDLIIESFAWFYEQARNYNVDLIVHGGDLLDKPMIMAREAHAIEESFAKNTTNIPEYVLVGNHDRKDTATNALAILRNYSNVTVIDTPLKINEVSFLPYTSEINLETLEALRNKILFSHVDIVGTQYARNIFCTSGFDPVILKDYFEVVFNGHIHIPDQLGIVMNTGSFIGNGLGDDYAKGLPSAILIDTETGDVTRIPNPYAVLYFTIESSDLLQVKKGIEDLLLLPNNFYLRIQCMNEAKPEIRLLLDKYMKENSKILSSIIVSNAKENKKINNVDGSVTNIRLTSTPVEILMGFIKTVQDAKLPMSRKEMEAMLLSDYITGGAE